MSPWQHRAVRVYVILDQRSSLEPPLGDAIDTFIRREDAERFIAEVRGDDPELASYLRIEERELEAGGAELQGVLRDDLRQTRAANDRPAAEQHVLEPEDGGRPDRPVRAR